MLVDSRGAVVGADEAGMWNYFLRHRLLLRAVYARSVEA